MWWLNQLHRLLTPKTMIKVFYFLLMYFVVKEVKLLSKFHQPNWRWTPKYNQESFLNVCSCQSSVDVAVSYTPAFLAR
jgi:hypothetical protein